MTTRRRPLRKRQMGDCLELELSELGFEISLCVAALRRSSIVKTWAG